MQRNVAVVLLGDSHVYSYFNCTQNWSYGSWLVHILSLTCCSGNFQHASKHPYSPYQDGF